MTLQPGHDMRDWPKVLRINSVAATLAPAIWYARLEAFGLPDRLWEKLTGPERQVFIAHAARLLETLEPVRGTVVGRIEPAPITRCIYCGVREAEPGSDYCGAICTINAEREGA